MSTPNSSSKAPEQTQTPNRLIIGETERAGLPISAPVVKPDHSGQPIMQGALRWRKRPEGDFVLEQYGRHGCCSYGWHEVPCIVEP